MATLNEYFRSEARDFLTSLERSLQRTPGPDAAELHRAVRGLRGTAQMAREQRVFEVITAFEAVTRSIADGALAWSDSVALRARDTIADLRALLDPTEDDEALDARVNGATARWRDADPDGGTPAAAPTADAGTRDFREFAAREAADIADALDQGIQDLQADAMNRAPLTTILRRQRALLGSARLDEIPVISDILHAVEDLTRVIVKLDVGVKQEWLDIYRVARDALQTTIAPLLRDELPQASNSVSRLRHMRAELLERYGSTDESARPPMDPFAAKPAAPAAPFMAPARSGPPRASGTPQPVSPAPVVAPPFATSGSATPLKPATAPAHSSPATPARAPSTPARDPATPARDPGVLELSEDAAVDDAGLDPGDDTAPVLELGEDAAVDGAELEPSDEIGVDDGMLELSEDAAVDDAVLDHGDDAGMDAPVLELSEDAAVDEAVLELSDEVDVDSGVLDLNEDAAIDAPVLDLEEGDAVDAPPVALEEEAVVPDQPHDVGVLEFGQTDYEAGEMVYLDEAHAAAPDPSIEPAADTAASASPADPLTRALELRSAIERAAAHDPTARAAVEELYSLIRRALG